MEEKGYTLPEYAFTVECDGIVSEVSGGEMTIEEVPEEYRAEVEAKLPTPEETKYTLDEAATILAQEVSA